MGIYDPRLAKFGDFHLANDNPSPTRALTLRDRLEAAVDHLMMLLDQVEGDPDFEDLDTDLEPSLCGRLPDEIRFLECDGGDDREFDAGDMPEAVDEDGGNIEDDGEPSLGSVETEDQTRWGQSGRYDLEHEPENDDLALRLMRMSPSLVVGYSSLMRH